MAIEESKIIDLITAYKKYEQKCWESNELINKGRAGLYGAVVEDLESLLPRKTLADLDTGRFAELTGTIVEYRGMQSVILGGGGNTVTLFTLADKCVTYTDPALVHVLDEDRIWDETGTILK